jgi:di/tricarboxylate transporter
MTPEAWTTLAVIASVVVVLATTRIGTDFVMMGALTLLLTLGILSPKEALAGFANEGAATVGVLFVVSAGIRETGAMSFLAQGLLGRPQSVTGAQARMMLPVASASAFIYNAPLVAMTLPAVDDWVKKNRLPASKLMIPLSYAAILGGLCTLMGTSTNLVVNGLAIDQAHMAGMGLFDITGVGVPCALAGLAYILIASRWLLPDRRPAIHEHDDPRQYIAEMLVETASPLAGRTIEEAGLRHLPGLYLVEIEREGQVLPAVGPQERLRAGDRLLFAGVVESVVDLQKLRGLKPATNQIFKLDSPRTQRCLIEAVVSDSCPLAGQTIRDGRFRTVYNAAVIAVARNGERLRQKIGDITLRPGDTLLLEANPSFADQQRNSRDFYLVSRVEDSTPPRHERAWIALAILAGLVVVAGVGWLSMLNTALLAAALMVLTRCCSTSAARRSVDWKVLVVIAASIGIGRAMQSTGAAGVIAQYLTGLAGSNPWVALAMVYFVTMVFTEIMSHITAVVVVFPVALATANAMGVQFMPFLIVIAIAASCSFAMPIGYPSNLMVYGPGNYRFGDYLRFGGPLDLLMGVIAVVVAPLVWPF